MKTLFGNSVSKLARSMANVVVNEYRLVSPQLAKVTVTIAGHLDKDEMFAKLSSNLQEIATPIRSSFRWLEPGQHAVGFVSLTRPTRVIEDEKQLASGYRVMASNLFLDESDKSLWELKSGAHGKYLVRNSENEDLAGLLETARVSPKGSTPRMARIVAATSKQHELVAFVHSEGFVPFLDYGYCIGTKNEGGEEKCVVLSHTTNEEVAVSNELIVGSYFLSGEQFEATKDKVRLERAGMSDKERVKEYYRKAYFYAPDYLAKVIQKIEGLAAL